MHGIGHIQKPWQESVVVDSQLAQTGLPLGANESIAADDQPHLSFGQLDHHLYKLSGNRAIIVRQSLPCRRTGTKRLGRLMLPTDVCSNNSAIALSFFILSMDFSLMKIVSVSTDIV